MKTGLPWDKATKESFDHPGYFNSILCLRDTAFSSGSKITKLTAQHADLEVNTR